MYDNQLLNCYMYEYLLSILYMSISVFWAYHLYFKHDGLAQSLYILSMMFRHFEYNISLIIFAFFAIAMLLWTQQVLYFCDTILLTLEFYLQSRHSEENDKEITDNSCRQEILIPSTGDTYVTTSCCWTMCIIHSTNGLQQCIDCTYSGTKSCHGKLCPQVTMWHALLVSGQSQTHSAWLPVR